LRRWAPARWFTLLLPAHGSGLLAVAWGGAALGIAQSLFWVHAPRPLVAGVLYSMGAIIYAARRPDPAPAVFGYHEIFHALVVAAAVCHFGVVVGVIRAVR